MKDNSELKSLVNSWVKELNKIIIKWALIPGAPTDEFASLTHKLIGYLTKGGTNDQIHDILKSELIIHYGLSPVETELEQFTQEIIYWWNSKQ
ncbi:MAG: hypothetical protein DI538_12140 [Azospira oryzae]|nr:MAG: hypothetical protein DI538_12140 [Azospira oryzae]